MLDKKGHVKSINFSSLPQIYRMNSHAASSCMSDLGLHFLITNNSLSSKILKRLNVFQNDKSVIVLGALTSKHRIKNFALYLKGFYVLVSMFH